VHDYQLLLVPQMLRNLVPTARIGFFLHIPWPSSEVFSVLPWREEILRGLLGADVLGFHTPSYLRHFAMSLQRILGVSTDGEHVRMDGADVRLGVFPMGVDARDWSELATADDVKEESDRIRAEAPGRKIILGIDRLDYTKGIVQRLLAMERLFEADPSLGESVRMIQITVPSREGVEAYAGFRRSIDEVVGRINGNFASTSAVPIHRLHRSLSEREVAALYCAADVMLVTPLRDGMNLVAKEFVASRTGDDGVLVLSEFAGAAAELGEALHVNPYDIDRMAQVIREALSMPIDAQRERMRALRSRVMTYDSAWWASSFIDALQEVKHSREAYPRASSLEELHRFASRARAGRGTVLIIDYDGTLVPLAPTPAEATPDEEVRELLRTLASRPRTSVHVVTGRSRRSIERWLGDLPLGLHAEHGLWSRLLGGEWKMAGNVPYEWNDRIRPLMEHFVATTHGTFIEEKTASIAWHFRLATAGHSNGASFGEFQARELRTLLGELLSNAPVEVLIGDKVVEVRPQGVNKGIIVPQVLATSNGHETVVAIGDDRTDEDLFAALPDGTITVHVGPGSSRALYRLNDPAEVLQFLRAIAG
jgi:trehalose 6-phosphate synthase/phosphatase